jgi:ACS family tartrate transporter-like MFS transporter
MTAVSESDLLRKVAWRLVPFLSLGYLLAALDRFNVSIAALTMNESIGLSATAYGLGAGAFFWSYALFQFPSNLVLMRVGARLWLTCVMFVWGLCTMLTAFVHDETTFVIARFALGLAEAGYFPGAAYFMTCWFPGRYRGRMMGVFFAAGASASVIGGPMGGLLLQLDQWLGLQGWQFVFLVEGLPAVMLAACGPFVLVNRPAQARWLTPAEQTYLQQQLDAEAATKGGASMNLWASLVSPQVLMLALTCICLAYGVYSLGFFLPLMVRSLGFSNTMTAWLQVLPNICAVGAMIVLSRSSDRTGERVWHAVTPFVLGAIGCIAAAMLFHNVTLAVAALCLAALGVISAQPMFWNLPTAYLSPAAAAGGIAFINSMANISGYVAPQVTGLLRDKTGGYEAPLLLAGAVMLVGAGIILGSGIRKHITASTTGAEARVMTH